jgi:hypothetical protein
METAALLLRSGLASISALVLGVVTHLGWFIRGEHQRYAPQLAASVPLFYISATILLSTVLRMHALTAMATMTNLYVAFGLGLFGSMFVYRVFFHRLRKFPGPFLASVTQLYQVWSVRHLNGYLWLDELHQKYGPVVRIGKLHKVPYGVVVDTVGRAQQIEHLRSEYCINHSRLTKCPKTRVDGGKSAPDYGATDAIQGRA